MLDCGGDAVTLTPEEFVTAAKQCMAAEAEAATGAVSPDLRRELEAVSLALARARDRVRFPGAIMVRKVVGN